MRALGLFVSMDDKERCWSSSFGFGSRDGESVTALPHTSILLVGRFSGGRFLEGSTALGSGRGGVAAPERQLEGVGRATLSKWVRPRQECQVSIRPGYRSASAVARSAEV